MKIESTDKDIETLLGGSFFQIPRFQRPYSWDDENINEFWADLINNRKDDYFIGSMVVYKITKQQFGIVDGQQRLTTITILLCVLRNFFSKLDQEDLAKGLHQLIERSDRNNKSAYVLKTETSFPYFPEHIQKFGKPDLPAEIKPEEANIKNARTLFYNYVNSIIKSVDQDSSIPEDKKPEKKIKKITEIRDTVLNLNLIFVVLDNEDDAYLIFETLNTRGKDLAPTDLVKNHVTKHLKSKGTVDQAKIKWQGIIETIHNSSANISSDSFIYHFWASRYESVPLKKLFSKIKKRVTKASVNPFLDDLVADSKYYRSIHEVLYEWNKNEKKVSQALSALALFKVTQPTPAVLSLVRAYREKKIKLPKLEFALTAIEKFHFVFTAVTSSRSSGGISAMYSSFGRRTYEAKGSQEAAKEIGAFVEKLRERRPTLDEFRVAFNEIYFTRKNSKQKNLVQYILRKFSEHHSCKFPVDFDDLTIEHISPEAKIGIDNWSESDIGRIGNLLYIDEKMNGQLEDKKFKDKKTILMDAGYDLPNYVLNANEWRSEEIEQHTLIMAETAYNKIWGF